MARQNIQFNQVAGVDARSNPLAIPAGKSLKCLNFRPMPDGHLELREGYKRIQMTYAAGGGGGTTVTKQTLFTDGFNRTTPALTPDGGGVYHPDAPNYRYTAPADCPLGPDWSYDYNSFGGVGARDWAIVDGKVRSWYGSSMDYTICINSGAQLPQHQWVEIVYNPVGAQDGGSDGSVAILFRINDTGHGYCLNYNALTGEWFFNKFANGGEGASIAFGSGSLVPLVPGDTLRVEADADQYKFYRNTTLFATASDSTYLTGPYAGFGFNGQFSSADGNPPVGLVDSFSCGDWATTTSTGSETDNGLPIHSIVPYKVITDAGLKSFIVFWQDKTPRALDLSTFIVATPTVKGKPIQSSNRWTYYLSNNRLHAVNGVDAKWFDGTYWRDLGVRQLTQAEANAIVVSAINATAGNELVTSSGWTSAGWSGTYDAGFTHATGNTSSLSYPISGAFYGKSYRVTFTLSARTAGSVTVSVGGTVFESTVIANQTYTADVVATSGLGIIFAPTSDFNGNIKINSVKQLNGGIPASTIGGAQPGYQFYACLYNPVSGHIGNRISIGSRQYFTDGAKCIQFTGLPDLSLEDSELCVLIGRTADGGEVPYICTDAQANWQYVPNGTTSYLLTASMIDGSKELPVDNTLPPEGLRMVALVGDRAVGGLQNWPWTYVTRTLADGNAAIGGTSTGDYVGRPEQSWPATSETFPTAEGLTAVAEYNGDAVIGSAQDSAVLTNPQNQGFGWQGPWNTGIAGPWAICKGYGGVPYWLNSQKQLCTMGSGGPISVSSEYEAALLAQAADNQLWNAELVYEKYAERQIDRIRIHFIGTDGQQHHIFHDFKLGASRSPFSQYSEAMTGAPMQSAFGQGYEAIYKSTLSFAHTIATVRDENDRKVTIAGGNDGWLYWMDNGTNDNAVEFDAEWLGLLTYGNGKPLVGPFEYYGDTNTTWMVSKKMVAANFTDFGEWETLQQKRFVGDVDNNHFEMTLNRPEMIRSYLRILLSSHSTDSDSPTNMLLNNPPHCPLETYGRIWTVGVNAGEERG